ncbi:MAG: peptidoglycan-binding protein [Rhodobacteraceae bacterium]|nr:peptidoglycan-binding protein [Paracoccaceae bacterium]
MRTAFILFVVFILSSVAGPSAQAQTQGQAWVQVVAQPDLQQAEASVRGYAQSFQNVAGFALPSGWYAVVLGPYSPDEARATLLSLRAQGAIPADSYLADGHDFRAQFWPVGASAEPVAPVDTAPVLTTPIPAAPVTTAAAEPLPGAGLPDETPTEARAAEAALTMDDRQELQRALAWDGFYNSIIDGDFGPGTRGAMAAWQKAQGADPTGILTTAQRKTILDGYHGDQAALGLQTVADADAGITIDLPMAMVGFTSYAPPFARYDEKAGSGVQVLLLSEPGNSATLSGLYDLLQSLAIVPPTGARTMNERSFDITGTDDTRHTYAHADVVGATVKGYLITYKPQMDAQMARVLAAMKASFHSNGTQALDATMVPLSAAQKQGMVAGLTIRKPVMARSGFFIDAGGDVLTTTEVLNDCSRISFGDDHTATLAYRDDALGIALLKPQDALSPMAYAHVATTAPQPHSPVAVAGFSYAGALMSATLTLGSFDDDKGLNGEADLRRLTMSALPGDAGGPVLDAGGALVGMLLPRATDPGKVLPASVAFAAGATPIAAAVAGQGAILAAADPQPALAPEDLASLGAKMTVLVSCWK